MDLNSCGMQEDAMTVKEAFVMRACSLKILAAIYAIESGAVTWMGPHPNEKAMVAQ
jgi:hypothetical protein